MVFDIELMFLFIPFEFQEGDSCIELKENRNVAGEYQNPGGAYTVPLDQL